MNRETLGLQPTVPAAWRGGMDSCFRGNDGGEADESRQICDALADRGPGPTGTVSLRGHAGFDDAPVAWR